VGRARSRLLLTADDGTGSLAAVRALRAGGFEPWVATWWKSSYAVRSRAAAGIVEVPDPELDSDRFVSALADAVSVHSLAAVLPGTEPSLRVLAGREDAFSPGVVVGTCPPPVVTRATDKLALAQLASSAGLETPPTLALTPSELGRRSDELEYPLVVKPLTSFTSSREGGLQRTPVRVASSPSELQEIIDGSDGERRLIQPYLTGELMAVVGVSWHGEVVCSSHQVARRIWPPRSGISAYAETVPRDSEIDRGVARLLGSLGWSGIFEAQFVSAENTHYLVDLNPRVYGSMALAVAAGLNLPAIWAELLLGEKPEARSYRAGVRYRSEENDAHALRRAFAEGMRLEALRGLLPRRRTVHAIFSLRDPLPLVESLAKGRAKIARRAARHSS